MQLDRDAQIDAFLEGCGWGAASISPLAGDASNRRYLRLNGPRGPAVLMDAPPDKGENVAPFVAMTDWLRTHALSAPELLACDAESGFLLLEDLGDNLYASKLLDQPEIEAELYAAAVRLLVALSAKTPPAGLAPYDRAALDREAALFTEWWLPAARHEDLAPASVSEFQALVAQATREVATSRSTVVLRDYHAENLIWLPDRAGHAKVGLLDYQDALAGHPAYDLVSLLEDARRDTSDALQDAMLALYLDAQPSLDRTAFRAAYAALGAQRNLKIIGIFARLCLRDRKPRYLSLIPRVWGHLMRDLQHPDLSALRDWVLRHSPAPSGDVLERIAQGIRP